MNNTYSGGGSVKKRRGRKEVERKCEEGEREKSERKLREQTKSESKEK